MSFVAIIMAGGSGKRFWPLSRENKAKQSLALFSEKTLLQETVERILPLTERIVVVSSIKQKKHIANDLAPYPSVKTIYEPLGRNTAPCIYLAMKYIEQEWNNQQNILVLPADHHIADQDSFRKSIAIGMNYLLQHSDMIGTIGIAPTRPETGYGYIKKGAEQISSVYSVECFEEKPSLDKAVAFYNSGNYLWNGGIFLFNHNHMDQLFQQHQKEIVSTLQPLKNFTAVDYDTYAAVPAISIDYGIMERSDLSLFSVAGSFGWNDIGSWLSYYELLEKDSMLNAVKGKAHLINCTKCMIVNLTERPVVLMNKEEELVVQTEDVVFSTSLRDHQEVRKAGEYLSLHGISSLL